MCNAVPEDLHPKSFRAAFGHNTNIWLMTNRQDFKALLYFSDMLGHRMLSACLLVSAMICRSECDGYYMSL